MRFKGSANAAESALRLETACYAVDTWKGDRRSRISERLKGSEKWCIRLIGPACSGNGARELQPDDRLREL
jgi:hypothetical protein